MKISWEVILWTSVTLAVLMGLISLAMAFISSRNLRNRRRQMEELQTSLRPGVQILFAGGFYGTIVSVGEEILEVEVSRNSVIKVSRYAVQSIVKS